MKTWYDFTYTIRKIVKFSCLWASETRVRPRFRRWPVGREGQRRIELRWKPDFASRSAHEPSSTDYVGKNRRKMPKRYSPLVFVPLNQPRPLWECAIFFPSGEHPVWTSTWYFVIPIFGIFIPWWKVFFVHETRERNIYRVIIAI